MTIRRYWFIYDLSTDRERTRVERCLQRYGIRLQKSVFQCVLDQHRLDLLCGELQALSCTSGTIFYTALQEPMHAGSLAFGDLPQEDWAFVFS